MGPGIHIHINESDLLYIVCGILYLSSVVKLDQAGRSASACTGLYRQKGKQNPGDTGTQPKQLHIREDTNTTNLPVLDPMVFLNIF
jgi:hypothetical protein